MQAAYVLAENAGESFSASELSKRLGVSAKYLERIMRALCSVGAVRAARGAKGGYCLGSEPQAISVGTVVRALEDDLEIIGCVKSGECGKCASSAVWKKLYHGINALLDGISLADMVQSEAASHKANGLNGANGLNASGEKPSGACNCSVCGLNCDGKKKQDV